MALGLILEINGYKYKLLKYNRRFNQKRHCIVGHLQKPVFSQISLRV